MRLLKKLGAWLWSESPDTEAPHMLPAVLRQMKLREQALGLAKAHGIRIDRCDPGFNVWPPAQLEVDPWEGNHYCKDWHAVLEMVRVYAGPNSAPREVS